MSGSPSRRWSSSDARCSTQTEVSIRRWTLTHEGEEGKFYVWTEDEIRAALPQDSDFDLYTAAFGVTERGNWEGKTVLQRVLDDASLGVRFKLSHEEVVRRLADCNMKLLRARSQRIRPGTDDKVLTAWNGLMLQTFAEAARIVEDQALASAYLNVAIRNANFLLAELHSDGRLHRSWRAGRASNEGFLEDYAALSGGLVELYQVDFDQRWFMAAKELADAMITKFSDPSGGFFDTAIDAETLPVRPKDIQDNATPSGNALACEVLLKLAALSGNGEYRDHAERALAQISDAAMRFPSAFGRWLSAADHSLSAVKQIAVVYEGALEAAAVLTGGGECRI